MNIFVFWYGPQNNEVKDRLKKIRDDFKTCNIHVGPSVEEHNKFMNNKYYREAYESKKFTWMSNYARAYWAYNYGGVYFDLFTNYNKKEVINLFDRKDEVFFKGETGAVMSSFFKSNKDSNFFKLVLSIYEEWSLNPMFATCPSMYSLILWRNDILSCIDEDEHGKHITILNKSFGYRINGIKIFDFNGQATWNKGVDPKKEKEKIINNYLKGKVDKRFKLIYFVMSNILVKSCIRFLSLFPIPKRNYIRELSKLDSVIKKCNYKL